MNQYFYRAFVKFKHGSSRNVNGIVKCEPGDVIYYIHVKIDNDYATYNAESGDGIKYVDITTVSKLN